MSGTDPPRGPVPPKKRSDWTYAVFLVLGAAYSVLGLVFWLHDRSGVDLLFVWGGVFIILIGVGFRLATTRFFPPSQHT